MFKKKAQHLRYLLLGIIGTVVINYELPNFFVLIPNLMTQ